ncbi:hypothetical protein [Brevibacillus laterosporus]|uniref:hypothetical protein n=1 Tax=Brevibacillus laterosporus TaxID=1465 RepID=UPI003CC83263
MRWYRNGETHRFEQPVGKQYTYGQLDVQVRESFGFPYPKIVSGASLSLWIP